MPSSAAAYVQRAVDLWLARDRAGSTDLAEKFFSSVLDRQPDLANAAYHLGLIAAVRDDYATARTWYKRNLEQNPSHRAAADRLADLERSHVGR
jgi:tetratricopeptide (TPR) repeat protein